MPRSRQEIFDEIREVSGEIESVRAEIDQVKDEINSEYEKKRELRETVRLFQGDYHEEQRKIGRNAAFGGNHVYPLISECEGRINELKSRKDDLYSRKNDLHGRKQSLYEELRERG